MPGRGALRILLACAVALVCMSSRPASAVSQCGPDKDSCQCGKNDPYPCCSNGGNCTWWAWEQACCKWGVGLPGWGNANQWAGNAKTNPNYDVLSKPVAGSVANRVSGSYGHVAWTTAVSGSSVTVTEQNCWGGWGHDTASYSASFFDGGYIVRHSQCECTPGESQTQSCGNCGEQKRTCNSSCQWNSWGACGGEGACTPGDTQEQACGDCGHQSRKCQNDCSWGAYATCQASAPSGTACDTGQQGVCAKGVRQCVDGGSSCVPSATPSPEICDGLDNDCNGVVDDGVDCWSSGSIDAGKTSKPTGGSASAPGLTPTSAPSDMSGGCTVARNAGDPTGSAAAFGAALAAGIALARRRRARRGRKLNPAVFR